MSEPSASVERRIAVACESFQTATIPDDVYRAAERCVLDWLGCAIVGATLPVTKNVANALVQEADNGVAVEFGTGMLTSIGNAALINGVAAHVAELDDIYSPALYHPGAPVIAAALAVTQATKSTGEEFLRAIIAGYEVSNRIGTALNPAHYEYWHTTGTVGTLGAAVAAAMLLKSAREKLEWTLGHAASMAAGLQQAFRSDGMTKPLHAGRAAEAGALAARLAAAEVTGASAMLSGPVGLGRAMSQDVNWQTATDGLFVDFTIKQTTFKRFSACGHTFAAVDAVREMIEDSPIAPDKVEQVIVDTYQKAIDVAGNAEPQSPFEARFSLQFGVAATLCGKDLMDWTSYDSDYTDAAIQAMMSRVNLTTSESMNEGFPALRGARVRIKMDDGTVRECAIPTRKGDPSNALSDDELSRKFERMLAVCGHGEAVGTAVAWVRSLYRSDAKAFYRLKALLSPTTGKKQPGDASACMHHSF